MALSPMLIIGCGGSGGKVVLNLRQRLNEELLRRGWTAGIPDAFQLKWVDVPTPQETHPSFGPPLPLDDYVALSNVDDYRAYDKTLVQQAGPQRMDRLVGWRPSPDIPLPVKAGAGQMRAIGRAVAVSKAAAVTSVINQATQKMTSGRSELARLTEFLGGDGVSDTPLVVIVSSMAGGTGAGIFLDVCDLVRASNPALGNRIMAVLFTAEIFRDVGNTSGMPSNTVAAASELMNSALAIQRRVEPLYNMAGAIAVEEGAGPSVSYVVGLQTMQDGRSLASPEECYRAVTESLLAMTIDEDLQQQVLAYDAANAVPARAVRRSGLSMLAESPGNDVPIRTGFVSSFGSSKVSVGSGRFGEWARDRLARSVVDYVVSGWRERGLELLDPAMRDTASDADIVEFLVNRDREVFFERCGLWEENEPDGSEHNQVLEGVGAKDDLVRIVGEFRNGLVGELQALGQKSGVQWVQFIGDAIRARESKFRGMAAARLEEGRVEFASTVVPLLRSTVSEWLAAYGLPVTLGLVTALRQQCETARAQLADEAVGFGQKASVDPSSSMAAAFQALGNGQCLAGSEFVQEGLRKGLGPLWHAALQMRCEVSAALLTELVTKVLSPLVAELEQVGRDLMHPSFVERLEQWPDGAGVSDRYAPPPSEFCLVGPERWSAKYDDLLRASAGSIDEARNLVGAGGFDYGPPAAPARAKDALEIDVSGNGWLGREARPVKVNVALRPDDVIERVRCWLGDDGHPIGRFLQTGLGEYLLREERGQPVPDHLARLDRFRDALASARQLAAPLFRVSSAMMQRVHPDLDALKTELRVQAFPFDPTHPARAAVQELLYDPEQGDHQWCANAATKGVESVLLVSRLVYPVHPAAVASLYQPIAQKWNEVIHSTNPAKSIEAFWNYNRARLLTEFIPLPKPSIEAIVRGWFVGRLLGMVTDPTEVDGVKVRTTKAGQPIVHAMPWPLLRHGREPMLHRHRMEWLPALLEHVGMSMMLLSQDEHALDGYQALFDIGAYPEAHIESLIMDGVTAAGAASQIVGSSPDERKTDFVAALGEILVSYQRAVEDDVHNFVGDFAVFRKIAFGQELFPMFVEQVGDIQRRVERGNSNPRSGVKLTLVAPATARSRLLVDTLVELAVARMISSFVCVEGGGGARWIDADGAHDEEPLGELLARIGRLELVRIVGVSLDENEVDPAWARDLASIRDSISAAQIPVTLGTVASCTATTQVPQGVLGVFWNFNIVIVPQESLGEPGTFPVLITDPDRELTTMVAAVALVGSLWRWLESSPVDSLTHAGEGNVQRVRLGRVITRIIDAGDLTAQAVSRALVAGVQLPPPSGCVQHGMPQEAVDQLLEKLAPSKGTSVIGFAYQPYAPPERRTPMKMGPLAAIRFFFNELFSEIRPMPRAAVMRKLEEVRQRVETAVQNRTFGEDGDVVVRLRRPDDAALLFDQDARRRAVDRLPNMKSAPIVPSPSTWQWLLGGVLAAADGSPMPKVLEAVQPEWNGDRAVITDLSLLSAPPETEAPDTLSLGEDELASCGVGGGERSIAGYDVMALQHLAGTEPAAASPSWAPPNSVEASSESEAADGTADVTESATSPAGAHQRVKSWIEARSNTLQWRLAARLVEAQDSALVDLERTQAALDQIEAQIDEARSAAAKSRRSFVRTSLLIIFAILVLATLAVVGLVLISAMVGLILAGIFLLGLLGGLWKMTRLAAERVRWKHRLEDLALAPALLFAQRQHAADEFRRLSSLYQQYLDWADVLTSALYRPWGIVDAQLIAPWRTRTGVLSFSVGEPVVSQSELAAAALGVAQRVAMPGWLSKAYKERRQHWIEWYASMSRGVTGLPPTPEEDAASITGPVVSIPASFGMDAVEIKRPRSQFRESILAGDFADEYRVSQVESLRDEVTRRDPAKLIERVVADVKGLTDRSAHDFLRPPIESNSVPTFDHELFVVDSYRAQGNLGVTSWAGISPSILSDVATTGHSHAVLELDDRFLLASFRLDLSEAILASDCPLVADVTSNDEGSSDDRRPDRPQLRG